MAGRAIKTSPGITQGMKYVPTPFFPALLSTIFSVSLDIAVWEEDEI